MTGLLVCSLGGQYILESKTRNPFLSETGIFEDGELPATSAFFGLDIALPVFFGHGAAYAMLAVSNAVVDVMVINRNPIIIPLPVFPVAVIFFICRKFFYLMRWRLVGKWTR